MNDIINNNKELIKKSFGLDKEEQYDLATLWTLGTYFLKHAPDMEAFRFFGMLGFISPEESTGKSTALDTVAALSLHRGSKTVAAILDTVTKLKDKNTVPLDELHKFLGLNPEFDNLFNLGYMCNSTIERLGRFSDDLKETSAYFPKPFAALSTNNIQSDTLSRCITFTLYPREEYDGILDLKVLKTQNEANTVWSNDKMTIDALMNVELSRDDLSFMHTRKLQILRPLIAIAKITSDDWYQRSLKACEQFVMEETRERAMNHKVLFALYRIKELKLYEGRTRYTKSGLPKVIADNEFFWSGQPWMDLLYENGIPTTVKETDFAKYLKDYDPYRIRPMQINRYDVNWNGYYWSMFDNAFRFITQKEREQVQSEMSS